jgi:hypothetical protein
MKQETKEELLGMDFFELGNWIKQRNLNGEQSGKLWRWWSKFNYKLTSKAERDKMKPDENLIDYAERIFREP